MGAKVSRNTRSVKAAAKLHEHEPAACKDCKTPYPTAEHWCKVCNGRRFTTQFKEWTSGNEDIDTFIQEAQTSATEPGKILEWISFEKFEDVEKKGRGGFGTVYRAKWKEGYISDWDPVRKQWDRSGGMDVVLKSLDNSEDISLAFLKELRGYVSLGKHRTSIVKSSEISDDAQRHILPCYGFTKHPTSRNFMLVVEYATDGNLRDYLHVNYDNTPWRYRLSILWTLAEGLRIIHNNNLVHRDFHSGNVLQQGLYSRIADVGLARLPNGAPLPSNAGPLGVMPYLAPEILRHSSYSKEGDIFAYGMLMWEISSGQQPYSDVAHDRELALQICAGSRPPIIPGTPECYTDLMEKCWDVDPEKRPTAEDLLLIMGQWDISVIRAAEEFRRKTLLFQKEPTHLSMNIHPDAIYVSRLLPNISNYSDKDIKAYGERKLQQTSDKS